MLCGKKSTEVQITQKIGQQRGNSYQKNEEISGWKAHTNTLKLNWNILRITDVFLNQKRVNVYEHRVKEKLSHGAAFTMCSHTFTILLLRKTSVIVSIFHLIFCVPFVWRSLHFSVRVSFFSSLFYIKCYLLLVPISCG